MKQTITHTIRDRCKKTKKDVEEFIALIDKGYVVMDAFNYKDETYYIMQLGHVHPHEEEETELVN